jgi:hypothetical protein
VHAVTSNHCVRLARAGLQHAFATNMSQSSVHTAHAVASNSKAGPPTANLAIPSQAVFVEHKVRVACYLAVREQADAESIEGALNEVAHLLEDVLLSCVLHARCAPKPAYQLTSLPLQACRAVSSCI